MLLGFWTGQKEGLLAACCMLICRGDDGMADCGPLAGRRVLSSFNLHNGRHM
ncbi:hypothetical protein NEUTE1DRAFT_117462, partial [Neurospora tetrasperma FGSC 2508]